MSEDLRVIVDADASPLKRELGGAGTSVRIFGKEVNSQSRGVRAFSAAVDKQKESMHGLATVTKAAALGIGTGLVFAIGSAIKTGMDFESQMARVKAVTGATGKEMDQLRKLAIKLGADTKFSALEAAEAMYELSSAGFNVKETSKALPGTLALAAASSVDLASAAEISSNALRGFGLQSSESTHVADVLAQSVNSSSVEMEDLQLSLKYIGPVAKATGEGFEEMISAVSLMGDAGIKGEQAGTSLRGGLLRLVKPTKQVQEGLGALGIDIKELQGPNGLLPLPQLVGKLQAGLSGLSKAQQAQALAQVFGTEALSGMLTVVDAGPAKLARLTKEFEHSDGASAKAAKTMNDTVKGSFEQLKGSFETVEIELYEHFSEPLKNALLDATDFVNEEGKQLQKALDEAMATPEFKTGDFEQKVDVLASAVGDVWKQSGLKGDITEGLVTAFNFALPRLAAAAGQGSVTVAKAFLEGFMDSDALGKLVISAWLFTKLGGFAALKAAGMRAGTEVGAGMATGIEGSAATSIESSSSTGKLSGALSKYFVRALKGVAIADTGAIVGSAIGGDLGNAVSLAGAGAGIGMLAGPEGALAGGAIGAIVGGIEALTGAEQALSPVQRAVAASAERVAETLAAQRRAAASLADAQRNLKGAQERSHSATAALSSAEHKLAEVRDQYGPKSRQAFAAENKVAEARRRNADATSEIASAEERKTFSEEANHHAIRNAAAALQVAIATEEARRHSIEDTARSQGWSTELSEKASQVSRRLNRYIAEQAEQFAKAGEISDSFKNSIESQTLAQAKLGSKGVVLVRQIDDLRDSLKEMRENGLGPLDPAFQGVRGELQKTEAKFGRFIAATNPKLVAWATSGVKSNQHLAGSFEALTGTAGEALQVLNENVASALKSFGAAKIPDFQLKILSNRFGIKAGAGQALGQSLPELGRAGGGYVNAPSRRDSVITALGRDEAVLNVHQQPEVQRGLALQKAMGFGQHGSLDELFTGVTRPNYLASGGFAGGKGAGGLKLPHPHIDGPSTLAGLGQGGVDEAWQAAAQYIHKHMGPRPGLGSLDGHPVSAWIIPILDWARQHGWDGSVTSGYRTPAEQIAAAIGYGLQHYGPAGPLGSNHTKIDYPGGAVDVTAAAQLAATLHGYPGKPNLVWGGPVMGDYVHFSATGHARGGFVGEMLRGMAEGGWARVGATIDPTSGQAPTYSDHNGMSFAELLVAGANAGLKSDALYRVLGIAQDSSYPYGMPMETPIQIRMPGASQIFKVWKNDVGSGQTGDSHYKIDLHQGIASALGWHPNEDVEVAKSGAAAGSSTSSEKVPATYHGVRTGSLDLGSSMPKSLHGVEHELKRRRAELGRYRAAAQKAGKENKPKIEHAIRANITALETRIQQLERERAKMRREVARKKMTRRLARAMGKLTGFEEAIAAGQRAYDTRSQYAEQVVGLEPLAPELPSSATDAQREDAERAYVKQLTDYINTQERPAYEAVLGSAAAWRNTILHGEAQATGMEHNWEGQVRKTDVEIDAINAFTGKVADDKAAYRKKHPKGKLPDWLKDEIKKDHEQRAKLPILHSRDHDLRSTLGEARGIFWRGVKDPINPPRPPSEGTGSFEESLVDVQGIHWPGQHEPIAVLPPNRIAGMFGGAIWDTQEAIEGLGLKISQAANSAAGSRGGGESEADNELKDLKLEQAQQALTAELLKNTQLGTLKDFLGEFSPQMPYIGAFQQGTKGMRVGQTGYALLHRDEMVTPDPKGPAGSQLAGVGGGQGGPVTVQLVLGDKSGELVQLIDARVDGRVAKIDQVLGRNARQLSVAPGR